MVHACYPVCQRDRERTQHAQPEITAIACRFGGRHGKHAGKPLVLNENGVYVLDSAEMNRRKERDEHKALLEATEKLVATMEAKPPSGTPSTETQETPSNNVTYNVSQV